jgi:hypothetical protein
MVTTPEVYASTRSKTRFVSRMLMKSGADSVVYAFPSG